MTPHSPEIPLTRDDITPEWLGSFLAPRNHGVVVDGLEVLAVTQGAATRLRIRVRYSPGHDAGLPEVLFVKSALTRRMLVADPAMYVTEVRFYELIRPSIEVEVPAVYACAVDPATGRHALVIEDLAERGARFPSAQTKLTAVEMAPLVTTLADLHAAFWGRADLAARYPWLETATTGRSAEWWRNDAPAVATHELTAAPYKADVLAGHPLPRVLDAHRALQSYSERGPATVVHGDVHIGNTYLLPDGAGGLLDWQLMMRTGWACDVAYLLVTGLDTNTRSASEVELLRHYLDRLRSLGVEAPAWDAAWAAYRAQMPHGLLSWLVTPTAMYDEERLRELLARAVAATEELDSYRVLL